MPTLTLEINYNKNEELVFSPKELQALYFYGIDIKDKSGQSLDPNTYKHFIKAAAKEIEHTLNLKLKKQIIKEDLDFYNDQFRNWGYLDTYYPVVKPFKLEGFLGTVRSVSFPKEWLSSRKTSDKETYIRRMFIVPVHVHTQVSIYGASMLYGGNVPFSLLTSHYIPNFYRVEYCTGFEKIPEDILDVIGKLAAIGIFNIAGDIALGQAALANYSLSIDGLSQSIGTTNSAENSAFSARIKMYQDEIKNSLERMTSFYKGITCTSM